MATPMFSENSKAVLSYLQANQGSDFTANDIAEALGMAPRSVNGTVTGLQKKSLVKRVEKEGFDKKVIVLTAEGAQADVNAEKPE